VPTPRVSQRAPESLGLQSNKERIVIITATVIDNNSDSSKRVDLSRPHLQLTW
jgi:hypothetical protein